MYFWTTTGAVWALCLTRSGLLAARIRLDRHIARSCAHHRAVGGGVRVGLEAERVTHLVERDGAELDAAFEHGLQALRIGLVFVEPGEFQIGRVKFFGDGLVDEVLDPLLGRLEALVLRLRLPPPFPPPLAGEG